MPFPFTRFPHYYNNYCIGRSAFLITLQLRRLCEYYAFEKWHQRRKLNCQHQYCDVRVEFRIPSVIPALIGSTITCLYTHELMGQFSRGTVISVIIKKDCTAGFVMTFNTDTFRNIFPSEISRTCLKKNYRKIKNFLQFVRKPLKHGKIVGIWLILKEQKRFRRRTEILSVLHKKWYAQLTLYLNLLNTSKPKKLNHKRETSNLFFSAKYSSTQR